MNCAFFIRMQIAHVVQIPCRGGAKCAGSRFRRNLVRHEKVPVAGHTGPMRLRIVVGPYDVVPRFDFRQRIRTKVYSGWFSYIWVDVDQPLKRHVANFLLAIVLAVFER